jgi:hypothetical protein
MMAQSPNTFTNYQLQIPSFNLNLGNTIYDQVNRTILIGENLTTSAFNKPDSLHTFSTYNLQIQLPTYTQGLFCDFEDHINRNRKLRIDFGVK